MPQEIFAVKYKKVAEKSLTEQERNDNIKVHPKFWVDLFWLKSIFYEVLLPMVEERLFFGLVKYLASKNMSKALDRQDNLW